MTISNNYPTIRPTLLLDFANAKVLDPRVTFTRSTTGTYYDGKTSALAEQNLVIRSQEFDNSAWVKFRSTVTANAAVAPDGTSTADKLIPDNGVAFGCVFNGSPVAITSGVSYTVSAYVKASELNFVFVACNVRGAYTGGCVNLTDGSTSNVSANTTITATSVGNGWYRVSVTVTSNTTSGYLELHPLSAAGTPGSYTGNGTDGIFIWGAQFEARSSATAYTATTTQTITNYIPQLLTASAGQARFDHNPTTGESLGLLIEEQRTNVQTYSEQFDNAVWTKQTNTVVTANQVVAPDGTITADLIVSDGTNGIFSASGRPVSTTSPNTKSIYLRSVTGTATVLLKDAQQTIGQTTCNLTTTWQRFSLTETQTGGSARLWVDDIPAAGIYIWGAQIEDGAFATSYIPTVASQVTRSADNPSMTGTNFSSWYNQAEGSIYCEFARNSNGGNNSPFGFNGVTNDLVVGNTSANYRYGATSSTGVDLVISTAYTNAKFAGSYTQGVSHSMSINGGSAVSVNGLVPPTTSTIFYIGYSGNNPFILNGTIKKLTYYPVRLPNAEIVEMTS